MKTISTPFKLMALAAAFIFISTGLWATTDLPSTTVGVRKPPSGAIIASTTSDKEGKFVITGLKAGTYVLALEPEPKKYAVGKVVESGKDAIALSVTWLPAKTGREKNEPITVVLPKDGIKITGTVVSSAPALNRDGKPIGGNGAQPK
jgi:hypothetical protein